MPLRSLSTVPPGGWRFQQTLPDGSVKAWASMGLVGELAAQIADFRKGNGLERATVRDALHDIEEATCARLHGDREWCTESADAKKKGVRASLTRLYESVRAAGTGARILADWLGEGAKPVNIALAQARANVCLGCDQNREGHKWMKLTANTVRAIAEQMREKDAQGLRVIDEERLHACARCLCPLPLKIHVPLATILAQTDEETLNSMPDYCWMTTERQSL